MGGDNYLGGHTVWDWRRSARVEYEAPKWQSKTSARLLAHPNKWVKRLGERLYLLELRASICLWCVETLGSPEHSHLTLLANERMALSQHRNEEQRGATPHGSQQSAQNERERRLQELVELNLECARIAAWADEPEKNLAEIKRYLQELPRQK